ncbi:hypothetical protein [Mycobacterium riyadhense]|uniref:hypothetical protein n=2 Tax=Mycobacterium riyadhense TaxID=486698 RepID=UPI00194E3457|nr:hypothetical protein [Mycobacterium riyadhense]
MTAAMNSLMSRALSVISCARLICSVVASGVASALASIALIDTFQRAILAPAATPPTVPSLLTDSIPNTPSASSAARYQVLSKWVTRPSTPH